MESTKAAPTITDIQVLRGIAVLLVLGYHLSLSRTLFGLIPVQLQVPGWVGVELFFVISGLVVTRSVMRSRPTAGVFLFKRAFRLFPAILLFLGVSGGVALLALLLPPGFGRDTFAFGLDEYIWQSAAVLGGYLINRPGGTHYMNGAMWSLSVEFQFYAAFAGVLLTFAVIRFSPAHYRGALLCIAGALSILVLVDRLGQLAGQDLVPLASIDYIWRFRFEFLLLGVGLALLPAVKLPEGPTYAPFLLLIPILWVALSEDQLGPGSKPVLDGFATPVMALCFSVLIYLARTNSAFVGQGSPLYRMMLWIGDRSYSIYLLHFPLMALVWMVIAKLAPSIFNGAISYGVTQLILVVPLTFLAAHLSFEKVEVPCRRYGERLLAKRLGDPLTRSKPAFAGLAANKKAQIAEADGA